MIKTSKKDVHQHSKTLKTSTQADKQFEDDVQERIRQAKIQLKASSPFLSDEEKNEIENTANNEITPIIIEQITTSIESDSLSELKETLASVQSANQHLSQDLRKSQEQIADLEKDLHAKTMEVNKAAVQYGGGGLANGSEVMTKNDLKIEFLNFTSAHIDQFNNRIKKTEDIVANYVNTSPQEQKTLKLAPQWLPWLNAILLGISSILLISILYKLNTNGFTNKQAADITKENIIDEKTDNTKKLTEDPKQKVEAKETIAEDKKITTDPIAIAKPAQTNLPIAAAKPIEKNIPTAVNKPAINNATPTAPKPTPNPVAVNKAPTQAPKTTNTAAPLMANTNTSKVLPTATIANSKPANAPIQQKTNNTTYAQPTAKPAVNNVAAKPISTTPKIASKAIKPIVKKVDNSESTKNEMAIFNAKRKAENENNKLREAIQPIETKTTNNKVIATPAKQKSTTKDAIYFGED